MKSKFILCNILFLIIMKCSAQSLNLSIDRIEESSQSIIFEISLNNNTDSLLILPYVPTAYSFEPKFINNLYFQIDKEKRSASYYFTVGEHSLAHWLLYYVVKPKQTTTFKIQLRKSIYHDKYFFCPAFGYLNKDSLNVKEKYLTSRPKGLISDCSCFLIFSDNNFAE